MVYGTEEPNGKMTKRKIEVYRKGEKQPITLWVVSAVFDDKANIIFDYGGADPWHDNNYCFTTQSDDRIVIYADEKIEITLNDSSDKMQLFDVMTADFNKRVQQQYK